MGVCTSRPLSLSDVRFHEAQLLETIHAGDGQISNPLRSGVDGYERMLGLQAEGMGICIVSVGSRRNADWLCPHERSRSRVGSLDELSNVLFGILVSARTGRNAQVVLQLIYARLRLGQSPDVSITLIQLAVDGRDSRVANVLPTR